MESETLMGTSPSGAAPRQLDCWIDGEGQLALWIHTPDSDSNGWQIQVSAAELAAALARLGVQAQAAAAPAGA